MKLKLVILEMEASTVGATDDLCKALKDVLEAVFPIVEDSETNSALSIHEKRRGE